MYLCKDFDLSSDKMVLHKNTCHNRAYVNSEHLYIGDHYDNMKDLSDNVTHCPQGHEYSFTNTYMHNNKKQCKTCRINRYTPINNLKRKYNENNNGN